MVEREADILATVTLDIAPRLLALHRDREISPYPFLELSRIPGRSYDTIMDDLTQEQAAHALEQVARRAAGWHELPLPPPLRERPRYREAPRVGGPWTQPHQAPSLAARAADTLAPYQHEIKPKLWAKALEPVAAIGPVAVHGELSEGQFLLDDELALTGVVDWDALHVAHSLVDLDLGLGGHRMHRSDPVLKERIWRSYVDERSEPLPEWPCVHVFWCLLDAMTLVQSYPGDERLGLVLAELTHATSSLP
jgi:aminoglycoside phosphotransferase (APT) family kinase protein